MAASSFRLSTQASTSGDLGEIIYNATTDALIYDVDGTGGGAAEAVRHRLGRPRAFGVIVRAGVDRGAAEAGCAPSLRRAIFGSSDRGAAMDHFLRGRLGKTEVMLPQLGFGGAPLGNLFDVVSDAGAMRRSAAAWSAGIRYYDTAPWYGRGLSEHRIGRALRRATAGRGAGLHQDRTPVPNAGRSGPRWQRDARPCNGRPDCRSSITIDYSYDGVMRSHEDSLQRLGLASVDMLVIHDLDLAHHGSEPQVAAHGAAHRRRLSRAGRAEGAAGRIRAIGCGVNDLGTIPRFAALFDLDFFLVALRYTLGEQETLVEEIPILEKRGIGMIIGGVFNSGLYAAGPKPGIRYTYREPSPESSKRPAASRLSAGGMTCRSPPPALQFLLHHPLVASVIPGALRRARSTPICAAAARHTRRSGPSSSPKACCAEDAPTP